MGKTSMKAMMLMLVTTDGGRMAEDVEVCSKQSNKNECVQSIADRANMEDGKYYNDRWV